MNKPSTKPNPARSRFMTTGEAAGYLGLGVSTLERHRCMGTGPQFFILGNKRSIRYQQPDLDKWCKPSTTTKAPIKSPI